MTDYYVDAVTGDNGNNGLSWETAWKTLQYAANTIAGGDTVHARNAHGAYAFTEQVLIPNSCSGSLGALTTFITEDDSVVNGENIRDFGLVLYYCSYVQIEGFEVINHLYGGITLYGTNNHHNIITDNYCHNNKLGIEVHSLSIGDYNEIIGNNSSDNLIGIIIYGNASDHNYYRIEGNTCTNNTYSAIILQASYATVESNILTGAGIESGVVLSDNGTIQNNIITNFGSGILLSGSDCYDNDIINNTIKNCESGIFIFNLAHGGEITQNTVQDCTLYGIVHADGGCYGFIIHFNDFVNNGTNTCTSTLSSWDKDGRGNYWGYGGKAYDADCNYIGDTPYQIPPNYDTDDYPLMCSISIWPACPYTCGGSSSALPLFAKMLIG